MFLIHRIAIFFDTLACLCPDKVTPSVVEDLLRRLCRFVQGTRFHLKSNSLVYVVGRYHAWRNFFNDCWYALVVIHTDPILILILGIAFATTMAF